MKKFDTKVQHLKYKVLREVIKKADSIPRSLEYAARALEPYEEYLD